MTTPSLAALPVGKAVEPHPTGQWGMGLLIATEAALFAYLLFAYFYLAARSASPWPPDGPPSLHVALPNTLILLTSSGVLYWGEAGLKRGEMKRVRVGLLATILLGLAFLGLQGLEYSQQTFAPSSHAYGSAFFTITGLHGAHVLAGTAILGVVLGMSLRGSLTRERHHFLSNAALYWHFVDAVWLAVLTSLYLIPRIGL